MCSVCSSGNHAAALALAAQLRGLPAYIVVPNNAPACKLAAVKEYGGELAASAAAAPTRCTSTTSHTCCVHSHASAAAAMQPAADHYLQLHLSCAPSCTRPMGIFMLHPALQQRLGCHHIMHAVRALRFPPSPLPVCACRQPDPV
jgi:hypothetical protein